MIFNFIFIQENPLINLNLILHVDKEISSMLSNCLSRILVKSSITVCEKETNSKSKKYLNPSLFDMPSSLTITSSVVNFATEFISNTLDKCLMKTLNTE